MTNQLRDPTIADVPDKPAWTDAELRTLIEFRRRKGRCWKGALLDLYLFGKDDAEPNGSGLRHIRNRQGPSRVHAMRKATLDEAEKRLFANACHPAQETTK